MTEKGLETVNIAHKYTIILETQLAMMEHHALINRTYTIDVHRQKLTIHLRYNDKRVSRIFLLHEEFRDEDSQLIAKLQNMLESLV